MEIKLQDTTITLTDEQVKEIADFYNAPKFEYPLFKKSKYTNAIVKFTDLRTGIVVFKGTDVYSHEIGHTLKTFIPHTDVNTWEDVPYDKERNLFHTQPIYYWDDYHTHSRLIGFYNAIQECGFSCKGKLKGLGYSQYEAILPEHYTDWIIEAHKTLEE